MLKTFIKRPGEQFPIKVNFSSRLAPAETITYVTVSSILTMDGTGAMDDIQIADGAWKADGTITAGGSPTTSIVYGWSILNSFAVYVGIQGGVVGTLYKITVKVKTDLNNDFEDDIFLRCLDIFDLDLVKQPYEEFVISQNFQEALNNYNDSDTIKSITVTAIRLSDGSDATGTVIKGSQISGKKVLVNIKNGVVGEAHRVQIKMLSNKYRLYERNIMLMSREV